MRRLTMVVLMAALAVGLTACGRKGRPIPPEGAQTRIYPEIKFPKNVPSPESEETETEAQ